MWNSSDAQDRGPKDERWRQRHYVDATTLSLHKTRSIKRVASRRTHWLRAYVRRTMLAHYHALAQCLASWCATKGRAHISARTHASAAQEPPCTAALLNGAGCVRPSTPKARTRSLSAIPCIALGCALRNGEPQRLPDQQTRHPRPCVEDD